MKYSVVVLLKSIKLCADGCDESNNSFSEYLLET